MINKDGFFCCCFFFGNCELLLQEETQKKFGKLFASFIFRYYDLVNPALIIPIPSSQ